MSTTKQPASPAPTTKPGLQTTELWGKAIVQAIVLANALFDLGLDISDELALGIVGLLEMGYALSRSITKRAGAQAPTPDALAAAMVRAIGATPMDDDSDDGLPAVTPVRTAAPSIIGALLLCLTATGCVGMTGSDGSVYWPAVRQEVADVQTDVRGVAAVVESESLQRFLQDVDKSLGAAGVAIDVYLAARGDDPTAGTTLAEKLLATVDAIELAIPADASEAVRVTIVLVKGSLRRWARYATTGEVLEAPELPEPTEDTPAVPASG
jgi:hypothetical protein